MFSVQAEADWPEEFTQIASFRKFRLVAFHSFEDLEVWKRACALAVFVYEQTRELRDFGLRDQMQRAAVSVASNIAEGAERGDREFVRFLVIARGSSSELRTQTYIAFRIGLLGSESMTHIVDETRQINRMLTALAHFKRGQLNTDH